MEDPTGRSARTARAFVAACAFGYVAGTLPSADIASRLKARLAGSEMLDLRHHGTGNPGGLNAANVLGARWGAAVMVADFLKGALASIGGRRIAGDDGTYVAGAAAVLGHCLPIWSGFRGGKGVATSAGSALVCFPVYSPFDTALVAALVRMSRGDANRAVVITSSAFTVASLVWWRLRLPNLWGPRPSLALPVYAAATSALLAWRMLTAPSTQPASMSASLVAENAAA